MKNQVYISVGRWHGSANDDGRTEGVIIRIGQEPLSGEAMEVEMSYEEWGKVLAGVGGKGTERE